MEAPEKPKQAKKPEEKKPEIDYSKQKPVGLEKLDSEEEGQEAQEPEQEAAEPESPKSEQKEKPKQKPAATPQLPSQKLPLTERLIGLLPKRRLKAPKPKKPKRTFWEIIELDKKQLMQISIILLFALVLRLLFMSQGLDDFDSFYFARALDNFDPLSKAPHFPYYIVYYAISKVFFMAGANHALALALPSALLGSLIVVPTYYIAKKFLIHKYALVASIMLAINPLMWLKSEIAMSDMTAAFFLVTSFAFLLGSKGRKNIMLSAFFFALAVGTRQMHIIFFLVPIYVLKLKRPLAEYAAFAAMFSLIWFIPLFLTAGGTAYLAKLADAYLFRMAPGSGTSITDTVFAPNLPYSYSIRFGLFGYLFAYLNGFSPVGVNVSSLLSSGLTESVGVSDVLGYMSLNFFGLVGLALVGLFFIPKITKKPKFLYVWFVPFLIWFATMQTPFNARYLAPIIPAFVILLACGVNEIGKLRGTKFAHAVAALLLLVWLIQGLALVGPIHNEPAPPVSAIEFVNQEHSGYIVVGYGEVPFYNWYAPDIDYIEARAGGQVSLPDPPYLVDLRVAYYRNINTQECYQFTRKPESHFKHSTIILCEVI